MIVVEPLHVAEKPENFGPAYNPKHGGQTIRREAENALSEGRRSVTTEVLVSALCLPFVLDPTPVVVYRQSNGSLKRLQARINYFA